MKYLIYYSTKGGVGKSTISKLSHQVLADNNLKKVAGDDTDPQQHYSDWLDANQKWVSEESCAEYYIYDTQGAHTDANVELLNAAKGEDAIIMIPVRPSDDDIKEAKRIADRLSNIGITDKCLFFFNGCIANCNYADYRKKLEALGIRVARKQINTRKAFAEKPTMREINDVSALLLEVLI
jgi:cellulose biosynthesis protein BcsQ